MTTPIGQPAPSTMPPPPQPMGAMPAAMPAPQRPGGVTFACVLSIVFGALGALGGLLLILGGAFLGALFGAIGGAEGLGGALGASIGMIIGVPLILYGALGVVAGLQALKGASWARWTLVALFGIGVLFGLMSFPAGIVTIALNGVALAMLVMQPANEWFAAMQTRTMRPT